MIAQLLKPALDIDIGCMLCNIIHKQGADSTAVIPEEAVVSTDVPGERL
jgi:hypothetical protein